MWIGIVLVILGGLYLAFCLVRGKIFLTAGTDLKRQTKIIDRETSAVTFWVTWVASAVGLAVFAVYLIRTALS
jgi:hypothetical protein